jgi:hypothetical protein
VRARDAQGLGTLSAPLTAKVVRVRARASVLALRKARGRTGAARYKVEARGRLLVDVRVVGTLTHPRLRLYIASGRGRIAVWRGTPGSSASRLRLGAATARHGFVTVKLQRALHTGRIRLVLVPSRRVVVLAKGSRKPALRAA